LTSDSTDLSLLNNKAFSLASMGRPGEARLALKQMEQIGITDAIRTAYLATSGLVRFRLRTRAARRKHPMP
jgi:hypothetical protein